MGNASSVPVGFIILFVFAGIVGCIVISCFVVGVLGLDGNRQYAPCPELAGRCKVIPIDMEREGGQDSPGQIDCLASV
jgi:hypothetical protein